MKAGLLTIIFSVALSTALLASCSTTASVKDHAGPALTEADATPDPAITTLPTVKKNPVLPPVIPDKKPTYGDDSAQCVQNYYLYRQSFRDWENSGDMFYFDDLLPYWRYVFDHCPGFRVNTFINGAKIYEHRISILPPNQKQQAIDTLLMIFDERIKYFGDKANVIGLKAAAMVQHIPENTAEVYKVLREVVKLNKVNTANHLMVFYMQYAVRYFEEGGMTLGELIEVYIEVDGIARHNISLNNATSSEYRESIERIEQLMLDYLDCNVMQEVFMPQFLADSTNVELCRRIMGLMAYKQCYQQLVFRRTLNQLNRMEPTPRLLMFQGNLFASEGNYEEALKAYTNALRGFTAEQVNEQYEAHMKMAEIYLLQRQFQNARASAMRALGVKPDDAEATMMLGDIYFQGRETCGSTFDALHSGAWAAFDKYQRARSLSDSPALQNRATNGMQHARSRFPSTRDIFFNNRKLGDTFMAPCWINETVTVRASDQ
jgi:tetratricopeptide (TPR) repeat protein